MRHASVLGGNGAAAPEPDAASLLAGRPALRAHGLDGVLLEGVPLRQVARELGTPCWVLGAATIRERCGAARSAFRAVELAVDLHYAVKANDNLAVLALMRERGVGFDVVSGGELLRVLRAGGAAERVIFSGVGKTAAELAQAVAAGVEQVNVESEEELRELAAIASGMGREVSVAIRVNPDVGADTLDQISTGRVGDKFGVAWGEVPRLYAAAAALPGIRPVGLAVHIGSQIAAGEAFARAFNRIAGLVRALRAAGLAVERVDCGGGLAIAYRGDEGAPAAVLAGAMRTAFAGLDLGLAVELGRWLVGPAGVLLTRVVRVKRVGERTPFLVVDAAMTELARPSLYGAWHGIVPVDPGLLHAPVETVDVVGPVCESSDVFARGRALPVGDAGSLYAILDAGAYGSVMSSTYNARPAAAQVLVDCGRWAVIRERDPAERLWERERIPAWLGS